MLGAGAAVDGDGGSPDGDGALDGPSVAAGDDAPHAVSARLTTMSPDRKKRVMADSSPDGIGLPAAAEGVTSHSAPRICDAASSR